MTIHIFDEDSEVPMSIANGAGIGTNRNAVGPLTVTMSGEATLGDSFELHGVEPEDLTVAFPPTHKFRHGETDAPSVTLHGGGCLILRRTKPAIWTGLISGQFSLGS